MSERRVTRKVSAELQTRVAAAQFQHSNPQHNAFHNNHNYSGYIKGLSGLLNEAENSMKDPQHAILRNTSEDMLIKSLVEGIPAPNMEGIGFTNLQHQHIRVDSEELFQSWMSLGTPRGTDAPDELGGFTDKYVSVSPSPSESSVGGAPVLSAGEDPCNSGQTTSLKRQEEKERLLEEMEELAAASEIAHLV